MNRILFALSLGLAGLLLLPTLIHANPAQFSPHDSVAAALTKQFGAQTHAMGLAQVNTVMELSTAQTGIWSLTLTLPTA